MNLVKRINRTHPAYRPYNTMPDFFNTFFDPHSFRAPSKRSQFSHNSCSSIAASNISETEDGYRIDLLAPGLGKEDLSISLEDGRLTVSYNKEEEKEVNEVKSEEANFWKREFDQKEFSRSFRLSEDVINTSEIDASMEKGILTITLPKKEEAKPRPPKQIEIA